MTGAAAVADDARLRAIIDTIPDMVFAVGEDGRIESFNVVAAQAFGYRAEELIGRDVAVLAAGPPFPLRAGGLRQYVEPGECPGIGKRVGEVEVRRRDGSIFPVELFLGELRTGDRPTFIATMRDSSDLRLARRTLETVQANLDNVLENANHATVLFDAEERLVLWNRRFVADYPGLEAFIRPGLKFEDMLRESIRRGALTVPEGRRAEDFVQQRMAQFRRADRDSQLRRLNDGRWLQISTTRSRDGGYIGLGVDVTELIRREEALRESEERLRRSQVVLANAQRIAGIGSWELDFATHELSWSDEQYRILGYEPHSGPPSARRFLERLHPEDRGRVIATMATWDKVGGGEVEYRIVLPSGAIRTVRSQGKVERDDAGRPARMFGALHDITERKLADAALRRSEAKFRSLAEATPFGLCVARLQDGRYVYANAAAGRLLGLAADLLLGRTVADFYDAPDRVEISRRLANGTMPLLNTEMQIVRSDGKPAWLAVSAVPTTYDGEPAVLIGFYDITERREVEDALRHSETSLANAQRIAHLGNWEWDIRTNELTWSDEIYRIFGLAPQQFAASYPAFMERVHPDDRAAVERAVQRAVEKRQPYDVQHRIVHPDGGERFVHEQGEVSRAPDGTPLRMTGTVQDVTEQVRAEQALRDSAAQLRLIADSLPIIVTYIDRNLTYRFVNRTACQWYVRPAEDFLGHTTDEVMPPSTLAKIRPNMQAALRGRAVRYEETLDYPDRQRRRVEIQYVPHVMDDGAVVGFFTVVADITERAAIEDQLRQAQKMEAVGQLTGGIAHDFNNLLAAVIGNLDLLTEKLEAQPGLRELARRAVESAERGAALTQRLLAFSRRQALQPKPVDAGELIAGMEMLLRRSLGERIRIAIQPSADAWPCLADAGQLESAILNLAINARDAMPDGGTLTIGVRQEVLDAGDLRDHPEARPGDYVRLSVSDTGAGMTAEVLKRAFEPFFTTKPVGRGSGLGLSMVHGFARQSGGQVRIESEINRGTTVHLYLPRATEPLVRVAAERPEVAAPRGRGEKILAVEDDPNVREFVTDALKALGYRAVVTGDAASALAKLKRSRGFGLLFTDLALPGGRSGIDLARAARRLRPDLPILFTSANADAWRRPGGLGPDDEVLAKPYRRSDLARALDRKLSQSPEA